MKAYKNEFDRLYEKLSKLFEDVDSDDEVDIDVSTKLSDAEKKAAADAFWASTKTDVIDTNSFHRAFDDDFSDEFKDNNFNPTTGGLKAKWTYGDIKALDQSLPSTKAVKKLWVMQFVDYKKTAAEVADNKRREKEYQERKKKAEEERAKKEEEIIKAFNDSLDKATIERVLELSDDPEDIMPYYKDGWYYVAPKRGWSGRAFTTEDAIKNAERCNEHYKKRLEELDSMVRYSICPWYKAVLDWCNKAKKELKTFDYFSFYFQDDNGKRVGPTYSMEARSIDKLFNEFDKSHLPMTAELVGFSTSSGTSSSNTYQNSYFDSYVSVSNKASQEIINDLGIDKNGLGDDFWGEVSDWKEISKAEAEKHTRYFIDGMDKWYTQSITYYSTD